MRTLYSDRIAHAFFFCVLVLNTALAWHERPINWDMLPYTWIALERSDLDEAELHAKTYETVKRHVTPEAYRELIDEPTYRAKVAEDPDLFAQQVDFYNVKPAFPMLMRAAGFAGLDPVAAGRVVSAGGYFAIGVFFFLILRSFCPAPVAAVTGAAVATWSVFSDLASILSPDALSAAVLMFAGYLFYVRKQVLWPFAVLILAGAIRPDNLILAGCILTAAVILRSVSYIQYALGVALMAAVYVGLHQFADYYGWTLHFYVTFVERIPAIRDFVSPLTLADYAAIYPLVVGQTAALSWTMLFAAFGLFVMARRLENRVLRTRFQYCFAAAIGMVAVLKIANTAQVYEIIPNLYSITLTAWLATFIMLALMGAIIVSIVLFRPDWAGYRRQDFDAVILPGVMTYLFVHFMLFPAAKDRMMAGAYLYVIILFTAEMVRCGFLQAASAYVRRRGEAFAARCFGRRASAGRHD